MKQKVLVVLMVMMALALVTVAAYAITIVVDGTQEAAWTTGDGSGQIPGVLTDPGTNEGTIGDDVDINLVRFTNDSTYYYILIETYAATRWTKLGISGGVPFVQICLDVDNSLATGVNGGVNCLNQDGVDRLITITGTAPTIDVFDSTGASVADGSEQVSTSGTITELRVKNSVLGFGAGSCPPNVPAVVYFDGGTTDPDDNNPDSGTSNFGCGNPTAVNLQTVSANNQSALFPLALGAFLMMLFSGAFVYNRKRQIAK